MKKRNLVTLLCLTALLSGCEIVVQPYNTNSQSGNSNESQTSEPGSVNSEATEESQGGSSQGGSQGTESHGGTTESTSQGGNEPGGSEESTTPTPVHQDTLTITKSNSDIGTTDSLTEAKQVQYNTNAGIIVAEWSVGCYNYRDYDEFAVAKNGGYFKVVSVPSGKKISTLSVDLYTHINIDVYAGVDKNGQEATAVSGTSSSNQGSEVRNYVINNANVYIDNPSTYNQAFYSITINLINSNEEVPDPVEPVTPSTSETSESTPTSQESTTPIDPTDYTEFGDDPIATDPVAQAYYSGISKTKSGEDLRKELQTLVNKNRCTTGYKALWNYYPYCDADPDNPTSGKIIAFYRGTPSSQGSMNKEHVWPNSRGGNLVEGDPHMTRPTLTSDNSSRGNSFYVEGVASSQNGWDPKADGMTESFRGDAARIIFYAAVANSQLTLVDKTNDDTGNKTMGKLSDLIKWNYEYPISKWERFRNEVLSGERSVNGSNYNFNRNPFIDDRSYVCRIWGNTNSETQRLCKLYTQTIAPTSLELNHSSATISLSETLQLSIVNATPAGASEKVTWTSSDPTIASATNGLVKPLANGTTTIRATSIEAPTVYAECVITVDTPNVALTSISVQSSMTLSPNETGTLTVTNNPSNAYPIPTYSFVSNDTSVATVNNEGVVTGHAQGNTTINVIATQGTIVKNATVNVSVIESNDIVKVTSAPSNWAGKYLIVYEKEGKAFNSVATNIDSSENAIDVTISNGKIAHSQELVNAAVTIEHVGGSNYLLKTSSGLVIKASGKNVKTDGSNTDYATFNFSSGNVNITAGSTYTLKYNANWGGFRFYASGQEAVCLYKLS